MYFVISLTLEVVNTNTAVTRKILRHKILKDKNGRELKISYISMTKFENKLFIRIPNKSLYIRSLTQCKVECIQNSWCVSLNFVVENPSSLRCDLFDVAHFKWQYLFIDAKNSEHHSISVRIQCVRKRLNPRVYLGKKGGTRVGECLLGMWRT